MFVKTIAIFGALSMSPLAFAETSRAAGTSAGAVRAVETAVRKEAAQREASWAAHVVDTTAAKQRALQTKRDVEAQKLARRDAAYRGLAELAGRKDVQDLQSVLGLRSGRIMLARLPRDTRGYDDKLVLDGHGFALMKTRDSLTGGFKDVRRPLKGFGLIKHHYFNALDMKDVTRRVDSAVAKLPEIATNGGKVPSDWTRSIDEQNDRFGHFDEYSFLKR